MKRNENKKQDQNTQATQKDKAPVIRVRSGLRAGVTALMPGCCPIDDAII